MHLERAPSLRAVHAQQSAPRGIASLRESEEQMLRLRRHAEHQKYKAEQRP